MNCKVIVLVLFLGLATAAPDTKGRSLLTRLKTASSSNDNRLNIFQGNKTNIKEHNYLVSIILYGISQGPGAIISESYVLTLADCLAEIWPSDVVYILAGSNDHVDGTIYTVKRHVIDPQDAGPSNDFGLLQIEGSFTWGPTVGYVSLPNSAPTPGHYYTVAGWGPRAEYGMAKGSKMAMYQGQLQWLGFKACEADFPLYDWNESMGCTMIPSRMQLCAEDYGDAILDNGTIYGLMMTNADPDSDCTFPEAPAMVANVFYAVDWINKVMNH